ncbi:MAG TPA: hypothetical protein VG815_12220, partial [Chloroflexota bacterium]|nr:hypothetical protein [Chloroflexota bacterium]
MNTHPPIPRPARVQNLDVESAVALYMTATLVALLFPGALLGAVVAAAVWRVTRPDIVMKWLFASLG